MTLTFDL